MPPYFLEDRFKPRAETLTPGYGPVHPPQPRSLHQLDPRSRAIERIDPNLRQGGARYGPGLFQEAQRWAGIVAENRRNETTLMVGRQVGAQLPKGTEYRVVISDYDPWDRSGRVTVYEGRQAVLTTPDALVSPDWVASGEQGRTELPSRVTVQLPSGEVVEAPVVPSARSVQREPGGLEFGEPRQLPADSRFDRPEARPPGAGGVDPSTVA
jgi:hypothetical protein